MAYGYGASAAAPGTDTAEAIVRAALDGGIQFVDTAPSYGESEAILGRAGAPWPPGAVVATKLPLEDTLRGLDDAQLTQRVEESLAHSSRRLDRRPLDVVQLHNPEADDLRDGRTLRALEAARNAGCLRWVGVSVYTPEAVLSALERPEVDVVQAPLHLFDQVQAALARRTAESGKVFVARSIFLRGLLTGERRDFPPALAPLVRAADAAEDLAVSRGLSLPELALRYVLSVPGVTVALLGMRSVEALEANLRALRAGPLDKALIGDLARLDRSGDPLVDPRRWPE
jgi:aryl-alcohol dehydrogenase-like predicted oxidoreductase